MSRGSYLTGAAVALALVYSSAQADGKDPLPDSLSLGGVTIYGTVDIGYAYQNHGVPISSTLPGGLEYQAFTTTRNFAGSVSTAAESGLEQSKIGIRVAQPIAEDWTLVARAETGFNPLSGHLTDACASLAANGGVKQGAQTANADSSRCGQAFNSVLFGGMGNKQLGTLTIGRQNSLQLDALAQYDPQALGYAFSFLGYSGFDGGAGSTQAARWDNSFKYAYAYGPIHFNALYSGGAQDGGLFGHAFGADIGGTYAGLSVDAVYEYANGAVNLRSSFDDPSTPIPSPGLAAYVSDNKSYNLMGKYTFELGGTGTATDKLTVYAGYSHIEKSHFDYTSGQAQGAYNIDIGVNINQAAVYNFEWAGVKYAMASGWSFTAAYYHSTQNSWSIGLLTNGTQNIGCSGAGLLCAGDFNEASFVVDYAFNKHYDLYAGVNWSEVTDGLANGFVGTTKDGTTGSESQSTVMVGGRVRF
ncbi:MAG TPA: porin [Steroidobacteraceae bacterium]|jgi:predicted porin|nr:porin [Steroidobacteraceae bacterium]